MAEFTIPLNVFKLATVSLSAGPNLVYANESQGVQAFSTVILASQISNNTSLTQTITAQVVRPIGNFTLLKGAEVPPNDALNPIMGKLILEVGDKLQFISSSDQVDAVVSILETAKE